MNALLFAAMMQTANPALPAEPQRVEQAAPPVPMPQSQTDQPDTLGAEIIRIGESQTRITVTVAEDGRVLSCTVTQPSGSASLDAEACRILSRRHPAVPDGQGLRTRQQRIVWRIEE